MPISTIFLAVRSGDRDAAVEGGASKIDEIGIMPP